MTHYAQTQEAINLLKQLPKLPKPHPSMDLANNCGRFSEALKEFARITGFLPIWDNLALDHPEEFKVVLDIVKEVGASICVTVIHPLNQDTLGNVGWIGRNLDKLKKLYDNLYAIKAQVPDVRYINCSPEVNNVYVPIYDTVYDLINSIFPTAEIFYYSRGNIRPNPKSGDGWPMRPTYTLKEKGNYLCCDLYYPKDPIVAREQINKTVLRAHELNCKVVPWTCFGCGYEWVIPFIGTMNEEEIFKSLTTSNPVSWWMIGRWLNSNNPYFNRTVSQGTSRVYGAEIPFVMCWPGPFKDLDPKGYWLRDFAAYCYGANSMTPEQEWIIK